MKKKKITTFSVLVDESIEQITPTLSKSRLRIFYKGINRNGSNITDTFAEKLMATINYAPVKGIFNVDFEDHGEDSAEGKIYGIVPENHNFAWETHLDVDGVEREYACVDVLLYTALYEECKEIAGKSQSMELFGESIKGEWEEIDGIACFTFEDACFLGLQVLGDTVEPCFEGSAFFSVDTNQTNYRALVKEYLDTVADSVTEPEPETAEFTEPETTLTETETEAETEPVETEIETEPVETTETEIETEHRALIGEDTLTAVEDTILEAEVTEEHKGYTNYVNSWGQKQRAIALKCYEAITEDSWIELFYDDYVILYNCNEQQFYRVYYTITEELEVTLGEQVPVTVTFLTTEELTKIDGYALLEEKIHNFELQKEEEDKLEILAAYEDQLNNEMIKEIRESLSTYTKDSLEREICYKIIKNSTNFTKIPAPIEQSGVELLINKYKRGNN